MSLFLFDFIRPLFFSSFLYFRALAEVQEGGERSRNQVGATQYVTTPWLWPAQIPDRWKQHKKWGAEWCHVG